ncbi:MAG: Fe-S cluster assembly protein SufB [Patescibacteria group bacterium]|nr:Fe-S cluster assembly protein SufB [Patescibacteria group bacterium]
MKKSPSKTAHATSPAKTRGLTREAVLAISRHKQEPTWMRDLRLKAFGLYLRTPLPNWGPSLKRLKLDRLIYFADPGTRLASRWEDVPSDIRDTFESLGIPEAERRVFSGAGAQFDSEGIYHRLKELWAKQGVIFEDMDVAVRKYPDLVRRHFMTDCVPMSDHKFTMLHAAVWSGGTFIYIPPGVKVTAPLQAYFRMNTEGAGQFEHTIIIADRGSEVHYIEGCSAPRYVKSSLHDGCVEIHVKEGARVQYSSVENWSKNVFNLNTKRAVVEADGSIEWLGGNLGSGVTMLYPMSVLRGARARSDYLGLAFAGPGQEQDTGMKVVHAAPDTSSTARTKSVSRGGGIATFRGSVRVTPAARNSTASVSCQSLLLDNCSAANAIPVIRVDNDASSASHEATVGRIGEAELFYLMSRGLDEEAARKTIVNGFFEPVARRLPLEYAVELNRLVELEMEASVI